jgi:hypothetical protein
MLHYQKGFFIKAYVVFVKKNWKKNDPRETWQSDSERAAFP